MSSPALHHMNLATQPFGRERAQNVGLAALCILLTLVLITFIVLLQRERTAVSLIKKDIDRHGRELASLERQQTTFQNVIAKPANADVFATSVFYNDLIARRSVSWTRTFVDLTKVMPPKIQLIALRLPQVQSETPGRSHIELDLQVGTTTPEAMAAFLTNLQKSELFGAAGISNQQPPTQSDPLYRFRLSVPYVQKF